MISDFALQVYDIWRYGGTIMPFLFATAFILWYAIGLRMLALRRGDRRPLRALVAARLREPDRVGRGIVDAAVCRGVALWREHDGAVPETRLEEAFGEMRAALGSGTRLIVSLIAMSPLLGLLGTVTGLIETFGSLGTSSSSAASEGIAGGIVEALYATQMGLAIAVPALLMAGFLQHRQHKLELEVEELQAMLGGALETREAA